MTLSINRAERGTFEWLLIEHHYAKRVPSISHAFVLRDNERMIGVVTFGTPGSRHVQMSACPSDPGKAIELNRLCILPDAPDNAASWFLARALGLLPPLIVISYADTVQGHLGYVYRAANFHYAGWTDMDRKTPRNDYVVPGKHSRDAFRNGYTEKVRRRPKVRYWLPTGNRREQAALRKLCGWPIMSWKDEPPPTEHRRREVPQ